MAWYSQLTQLILSFYREDARQLEQVSAIKYCKLSRRWGVLRVDCQDHLTAEAIAQSIETLKEPVAQLRLAQRINVLVKGSLLIGSPIGSTKLNSWKQ
jgi:hypothetical protein